MKIRLYILLVCLGFSASFFTTAQQVQATLGASADSVESDRKALSASRRDTADRNGYTVYEVNSISTVVREYVSPSGVVFGIAWNGLIHPDLDQLLGSYVGEYQKALQQTPRKPGQRLIQLKTDRIVVEKWGHMRNLRGRAYDPALIPSGVNIDEIR
jgi:hypothetical protein